MQNRMKTHPLAKEQITALLNKADTGALATLNADGSPYLTPVHFAYHEGNIYIHGLNAGQKIENILRNPNVSFTAWEMEGYTLHPEGKPCGTNTSYQSVVIAGEAKLIDDLATKRAFLKVIIAKYTPDLVNNEMADSTIEKTAVIELIVKEITGKYY